MKIIIQIIIALICFFVLIALTETQAILSKFSGLSISGILVCFLALFSSQMISHLRLQRVLLKIGYRTSFFNAMRAGVASLYGGLVLFGVVGQSISRVVLLRRDLVPGDVAVLVTWIERIVALAVLLILAGTLGSVLIRNEPELNRASFTYPAIILSLFLSCVLVILASKQPEKEKRMRFISAIGDVTPPILSAAILTLPIHLLTMLAYCVILNELAPHLTIPEMLGLSATVMLASSLPISFAGWGVRELSAAFLATTIGLSAETGIVLGLVVGGISFIGLFLSTLIVSFLQSRPSRAKLDPLVHGRKGAPPDSLPLPAGGDAQNIIWLLFWTLPLLAAAGLFFYLRIPTDSGGITASLADPLSILMCLMCIGHLLSERRIPRLWRVTGVELSFLLITCAIVFSFVHGYLNNGLSSWALYNRLIGWPILLAHFVAGASIVWAFGSQGRVALLHAIVITGGVLGFLGILYYPIAQHYMIDWLMVDGLLRLEGLSRNANSTSFQFLMATGLAAIMISMATSKSERLRYTVSLFFSSAVVVLTLSRVGGAVALALIGVMTVLDRRASLRLCVAFAVAIVLLSGWLNFQSQLTSPQFVPDSKIENTDTGTLDRSTELPSVHEPSGEELSTTAAAASREGDSSGIGHRLTVRDDRIAGLVEGIERWMTNPIFGTGLGSHLQDQLNKGELVQVIHSGYIWMLAEIGIVGLFAFLSLFLPMKKIYQDKDAPDYQPVFATLVVIVTVMALFNVLHDMVYQRMFWFLLGSVFARPHALKSLFHFPAKSP